MKYLLGRLLLLLSLSILSFQASAWNALGHMVIANIAYQQLKPEVKAKVDDLVSYLNKEYADIDTFVKMAPWPDSIRSQKIETYTHWHYIDIPFSDDGTVPPANIIDTDNAVWALGNLKTVVANAKANPYERARFLAFLIHIVGDQHQPLHTVSRVSSAHPDGDQGGNLYYIKYNGSKTNLHSLWDKAVGVFNEDTSQTNVDFWTKNITATFPQASFGDAASIVDPNVWTTEGMNNAKNYVYATPENETPSQLYFVNGINVAEQEVALAGYRLAVLLNQLLA